MKTLLLKIGMFTVLAVTCLTAPIRAEEMKAPVGIRGQFT